MKGVIGPKPFEDYVVYGPILHKKERRRMVALVRLDRASRTSMSYARYLMCVEEKRLLGPKEQVDHKDDDKLNDDIDNLQILSPEENRKKSAKIGRTLVLLVCAYCQTPFRRRKGQDPNSKGYQRAFCTRSCFWKSLRSRAVGQLVEP